MGPVTIAVDSFGPVSDNAQSIYELSMIESRKDAKEVVKKHFGVETDFEKAKHYLESADGAGNTFKATAKPVLIGTAVVGATTMVFGIIILLERLFGNVIAKLSLVQPEIILGLLMGGCVIYWFTGASIQAVVTGSYQAVVYIKNHIKLDKKEASIADSKEVVRICTLYAQKGMINIFVVIFFMALSLAFFNPYFFIGYLVGIAFFGLFQAIFMANAGGCWDNGKKEITRGQAAVAPQRFTLRAGRGPVRAARGRMKFGIATRQPYGIDDAGQPVARQRRRHSGLALAGGGGRYQQRGTGSRGCVHGAGVRSWAASSCPENTAPRLPITVHGFVVAVEQILDPPENLHRTGIGIAGRQVE